MENYLVEEHGEVLVIKVMVERATLEHAENFKSFVAQYIHKGNNKLVIDLTLATFMDSTFLGAIVINLKRATAKGGDLRLVTSDNANSVVWSMFGGYKNE